MMAFEKINIIKIKEEMLFGDECKVKAYSAGSHAKEFSRAGSHDKEFSRAESHDKEFCSAGYGGKK